MTKGKKKVYTRWFGRKILDYPTEIQMAEDTKGHITINILTDRDNMEPMMTTIRLRPRTFTLLSEMMFLAAHDPTVWQEFKDKE